MSTPYVGEIRLFAFSRLPVGWLSCDGSLQSISSYDALFALIGTSYGGDGQSTFGLPDLRGQLPLHTGSAPGLSPRVLGEAGGTETVTLLAGQLPVHSHGYQATGVPASATGPGPALELGAISGDTMYATDITGANDAVLSPASIATSGGSAPHPNLMPTLTVQFCIATSGVFPPRD